MCAGKTKNSKMPQKTSYSPQNTLKFSILLSYRLNKAGTSYLSIKTDPSVESCFATALQMRLNMKSLTKAQ